MGVALTAAFLFFFYNAWRIMLTVLIAILPIAGIALLVKRK